MREGRLFFGVLWSRSYPAAMPHLLGSCSQAAVVFLLLACSVLPEPSPSVCPVVLCPPGRDGAPGCHGSQGPPGEAGKDGLRGNPGPPGKAGPLGSKGDQGQKGDKGAQEKLVVAQMTSFENQMTKLQRQLSTLERAVMFTNVLARVGDAIYATNGKEVAYEASRLACEAAGGTLPMPLNSKEDAAILQIVKMKGKRVFLGINDLEEEGVFKLLTGERITYANWCPQEPNGGRAENCAEMTVVGQWNDSTCNTALLTVCEFRAH